MRYERELAEVIEIAREAGAMLRDELHRPGGPRGEGSHADIDEEVERFVRARLPHVRGSSSGGSGESWGYLGEETGGEAGDDRSHVWLVDPNDGTASFLKRRRGGAVSIGLLRDGLPVLGVVYAYAYPDDEGDLIAWAEGSPLTRNGRAITHSLGGKKLDSDTLVLVSQDADRRPKANGSLVYPARFAAVPSIAYRLALVAVGEAEAAVSLGGAVSWDYAAGHALVRASGGVLLGGNGLSIGYGPRGEPTARSFACFGGADHVVTALGQRDWQAVLSGPKDEHPPFGLASLAPRKGLARGPALARAQGCLLGQLAGDSLGSLVEFQGPERIARRYPGGVRHLADGGTFDTIAGQPTDDSEMALSLARASVASGGYDPGRALDAYVQWFVSGPFDMGGTTSAALGAAARVAPGDERLAAIARAARPESEANGSLMRASPLAILGASRGGDLGSLAEQARQDSALTHPSPVCQDACAAFVVAAARAIRDGLDPEHCHQEALRVASSRGFDPSVHRALEAAAHERPADYTNLQGWVLVALQNAFYQLLNAPSLEEGVVDTVMCGGDTDTNAAIAGALLGAVHGREAVPSRWRRALWGCRPMALPGKGSPRHPRPSCYWPVDALELAEALLVAGA